MSSSADRTRITIREARADLVSADVSAGLGDAKADGLDPQTLISIADEIVGKGVAPNLVVRQSVLPVETTVRQFRRASPRMVSAVARRLHVDAAIMVWQVTFTAAEGDELFAVVTQTQAIEDDPPGNPDGPDKPAAARPDEPSADVHRQETVVALARRAQIEAAAADIMARKGFAGASIREIAEAAGMHVPTLYQYIASKDELLELVYSRTMAALKTDLDAEVAGQPTAEEKLRAAIAILVGRGDRFRHRIGLLNRELRSLSPTARARVLDQYRELMGATAAIIRLGMATGEFRIVDPDVAANLVDGACDMWALRGFALDHVGMDAFAEEIAELIVRGLRRRDSPGS